MKRKFRFQIIIGVLFFVSLYIYDAFFIGTSSSGSILTNEFYSFIPSENVYIKELIADNFTFIVCPSSDCYDVLIYSINNTNSSLYCAFYDMDIPEITDLMYEKSLSGVDVKLILDKDNHEDFLDQYSFVAYDTKSSYMHDKFCIFDKSFIFTGSMNPTERGMFKNDNLALYIKNSSLASYYFQEFDELWSGVFGDGDKQESPLFRINDNLSMKAYFCPDDWCANRILDLLILANKSIQFATFSFTYDEIGNLLIEKANTGIDVSGVFEKSQNSKYSEYQKLFDAGLNISWDTNPATMHHKYFLIDNKILITGSMNPSKNGDLRNDENIIILYFEKDISAIFK